MTPGAPFVRSIHTCYHLFVYAALRQFVQIKHTGQLVRKVIPTKGNFSVNKESLHCVYAVCETPVISQPTFYLT